MGSYQAVLKKKITMASIDTAYYVFCIYYVQ
jgi:hypothetical protein